ncbi:glycosyl transferase family protein [Paraburkholderia diazotrophica]|nr:glycosyl transferase family protein [Paraburkholderia diazotrophica]
MRVPRSREHEDAMQTTALWTLYLTALNVVALFTACVIFVSTIDDLMLDGFFWLTELKRRMRGEQRQTVDVPMLRQLSEQHFAIMVPAWKEYDVIAKMVENTLSTIEYDHYTIFVGTYHNDAETTAEVERMIRRYPGRVTRATVLNDGPTCKADCLNWIVAAILRYEEKHHIHFAGVVMHDCEDVIHPIELKYFNYAVERHDLVQLPVLSLPRKWNEFVAGTYMDDFSETHQKDIPTRERLTGVVPGAGVASCYGRRAIETAMRLRGGCPFNTDSLTEDYDFSFRLREMGMTETFAHFSISEDSTDLPRVRGGRNQHTTRALLATREYFPDTFRTAYRQRARWILGIAFQGWEQLGWNGSLRARYMFFRDRKGMVTSVVSVVAYFVLVNFIALATLQAGGYDIYVDARLAMATDYLYPLLSTNAAMLFLRVWERYYFVAKLNGRLQGLLSIPRLIVNNLINFCAVCRAWKIYIRHLATGKPIAWDKTAHTFLSNEAMGKSRRRLGEILIDWGVLTQEKLEAILTLQGQCGRKLGELLLEHAYVMADTLADALAEQSELPRVSLANVAVDLCAGALPYELQHAFIIVPFSIGEDGTLNCAVGSPLTVDEQGIVHRGAGTKVAYFIAADSELKSQLRKHARYEELERARAQVLPFVDPKISPGPGVA